MPVVTQQSDEAQLVEDVVGRHAEAHDSAVADWAVGLALRSLAAGASLTDACREGRRVIDRWTRLESGKVTPL
ncbi:MAG: hypothetical protein QOI61_479 [Actinomycetota bacterium]|jgi:hypothetical protein